MFSMSYNKNDFYTINNTIQANYKKTVVDKRRKIKQGTIYVIFFALVFQLQYVGSFIGLNSGIAFQYLLLLLLGFMLVGRTEKYWKKMRLMLKTRVSLMLILFIVVGFVSLLWSKGQVYGFYKISMFTFKIVVYLFAAPIVATHGKMFFKVFVISSIVLLLIIAIKYGNPLMLTINIGRFERFGISGGVNPIVLGRYFGLLTIVNIITVYYVKNNYVKILCSFLIIITVLYTLLTGSKGPTYSMMIAVLAFALLNRSRFVNLLKIIVPIILVGGILATNNKVQSVYSTIVYGDFAQERYFKEIDENNSRFILIKRVEKEIVEAGPFSLLLGKGLGGYGYFVTGESNGKAYPHNIFVEIVFELGVVGIAILLCLIVSMLFTMWKSSKNIDGYETTVWGTLVIYFMVNAQVSADLLGNCEIFSSFIFYSITNKIRLSEYTLIR